MAKHRIRRGFQFGILDLIILTTIVAVVVVLCQPVEVRANKAKPWIVGFWMDQSRPANETLISLFPDAVYRCSMRGIPEEGAGWKLTHGAEVEGAYLLLCGEKRFIIRSESGSGVLEVLDANGSVQSRLQEWAQLDGPMRGGSPHGTWMFTDPLYPTPCLAEYRDGELVDLNLGGKRAIGSLNGLRALRGLPALAESDFPAETTPAEKPDE